MSKTLTVVLSQNGAAFAAAVGAVTEIGNGWYKLAANATDRNTLGELLIHATAADCDPADIRVDIVQFDPFIGTGDTIAAATPVTSAGATTLVRGSEYKDADGLALVYTLTGYPSFVGGATPVWRANKKAGGIFEKQGTIVDADTLKFELADTDTILLESGHYSLKLDLASGNTLKMPDDTLTILESI